jgi:hypothetical protein
MMEKLLYLLIALAVTYYTYTYGSWAMQKGFVRGGIGVFALAALVLVLTVYALYFRTGYR